MWSVESVASSVSEAGGLETLQDHTVHGSPGDKWLAARKQMDRMLLPRQLYRQPDGNA
jgi:hypothetical protein